jgi:WD40 repeat protein
MDRRSPALHDSIIRVWDVCSGREELALRQGGAVRAVAFSPDGSRLAAAGAAGARVWDARTGREALSIGGPAAGLVDVAFSPDGTRLATASHSFAAATATADVWDARSGAHVLTLRDHTGSVLAVLWSPDGQRLLTASSDNTVKVWEALSGQELLTLRGESVTQGDARSEDKRLTPQEPAALGFGQAGMNSAAFSPDGARLATGSVDGAVKIWDARTGQEEVATLRGVESPSAMAFSPDGSKLAATSFKGTSIWDTVSGAQISTLQDQKLVRALAFSPDGTRLATGSYGKTAKVWDARTGREQLNLLGHSDSVTAVAFSPDGSQLATASMDKTAKVWDARTGHEIFSVRGGVTGLTAVAFSSDGMFLATGSRYPTAKVWDAHTGQEVATLRGQTNFVVALAFGRDAERLAARDAEGRKFCWDLRTGGTMEVAEDVRRLLEPDATLGGRLIAQGERAFGRPRDVIHVVSRTPLTPWGYDPWAEDDRLRCALLMDWHIRDAEDAEQRGDRFAATFHTAQLDAFRLTAPLECWRRGWFRLDRGQRWEGLADLARREMLRADHAGLLAWHARACLATGDMAGYRAACARAVEVAERKSFPSSPPINDWRGLSMRASSTPWVCCLVPDRAADPTEVVRLAESSAKDSPAPFVYDGHLILGAALLRAGRPVEAIARLEEALRHRGKRLTVDHRELLLALAHHRLRHDAEARTWLATATEWMDRSRAPARVCGTIGAGPAGALPTTAALLAHRPESLPLALASSPLQQLDLRSTWDAEALSFWMDMDLLRAEAEAALARTPQR